MDIVNLFNEFRDVLNSLNISVPILVTCLVVFGVSFLISFREVILWFFNISALRSDLRAVRSHLKDLEQEIQLLRKGFSKESPILTSEHEELISPEDPGGPKAKVPSTTTSSQDVKHKAFRIFH